MSTETDYDALADVISSRYREDVLAELQNGPKTPSEISQSVYGGERIAHVSRALQNLRDSSLVELLVPEDRKKGRIYGLTDKGEKIAAAVEER